MVIRLLLHPIIGPALAVVCVLLSPGILSVTYPPKYKWLILLIVGMMTLIIPLLVILLLRWMNALYSTASNTGMRNYNLLVVIVSYFFAWRFLTQTGVNSLVTGIMLGYIVIVVFCILINLWTEVSLSCASMAGVLGFLTALQILHIIASPGILIATIFLTGLTGTASIIGAQSSRRAVVAGIITGFLPATLVLLFFNGMV